MNRMRAGCEMTEHARRRCQQRGMTGAMVDAVIQEADIEAPMGGGCLALSVSRYRIRQLGRNGYPAALLDRVRDVGLVVSPRGGVVTALHLFNRRYRGGSEGSR